MGSAAALIGRRHRTVHANVAVAADEAGGTEKGAAEAGGFLKGTDGGGGGDDDDNDDNDDDDDDNDDDDSDDDADGDDDNDDPALPERGEAVPSVGAAEGAAKAFYDAVRDGALDNDREALEAALVTCARAMAEDTLGADAASMLAAGLAEMRVDNPDMEVCPWARAWVG